MRKNPMFKSLAFVSAWFVLSLLVCITSIVGWRILAAILSAIMLVSMCFVFGYMYSKFERCSVASERPKEDDVAEPIIADKDLELL